MYTKLNKLLLLLVIVTVAMTSAVRVTPVYADDGGTEPATEESAAPPAGEGSSAEEEAAPPEPAPASESPQPEPAVEEPVPAAAEAPEVVEPAAPEEVTETTAEEPTAEEPVTVAEVLEQLPEETGLVVVNEAGEVEPLATVEAAEIIATGDPIWCPATVAVPLAHTNGCTDSHPSFAALIAELQANPGTYDADGIVWVAWDYDSTQDNSQINFDGDSSTGNLPNLSSHNLTIFGGWVGGTGVDPAHPSQADVSLNISNWSGNVTIEYFNIANAGDGAGFGLWVDTAGDIRLNNVAVQNTLPNASGFGEGAILQGANINVTNSNFNGNAENGLWALGTGTVNIANTHFNDNNENGLIVATHGDITVNNVTASDNTLTGAALNSCDLGGFDPGLCAGTGAVTITGTSNQFNHNGFNSNGSGNLADGLIVIAGGAITVDHVQVNNNSVNGASLINTDDDNTASVTVSTSEFAYNQNGTGVYVFSGGNVGLNTVYADANGTGAEVYTTSTTGAINISNGVFGETNPTLGNRGTGLHAESLGAINLNNVLASYNGANGAYLEAEGNIVVNNGQFNENVRGNSPADPGLRAISWSGNVTLNNVTANNNQFGAGVGLDTFDAGTITLTGGTFNQNGTFGIQAYSDDGDIALHGVTASYNKIKGAYLGAFWAGNIVIDDNAGINSTFVENGSYGIYAFASEGNISLDLVTVTGNDGVAGPGADDFTDYGAILEAGGDVSVTHSIFQQNTDVGLGIISGGQVDLWNVIADQNGGNGVEIYSITTAGPICEGETPVSIVVTVDGGMFTNNGGYGLMVKPGPEGTLTFVNPSTFGGNALGDYLIDLSQDFKDCTPGSNEEKPDDGKGPLIVEVPSTGGPTVEQDCDTYTGTILKLPDGTSVKIGCPFEGFSHLEEILEENLPGSVGAGLNFLQGIDFRLTDGDGNIILNEDGTVTISFAIPEDSQAKHYSIVFWDPEANNGTGGWVELPPYEVGTSFALHSDDPDDPRTVLSGVKRVGNFVRVTVDFSGTFALLER